MNYIIHPPILQIGINRIIMEFKLCTMQEKHSADMRINRIIMEFKSF